MKSCCCGIIIFDHHRQCGRQRKKSSLRTSIPTFVCILSSIIVLISSIIGTSNILNIDQIRSTASLQIATESHYRIVLRRDSGGTSQVFHSSAHLTTTLNNDHNHRNLQTSERCITITILLDQYPADTSWIITNSSSGDTVATSPIYDDSMASTQQTNIACLAAPGSYSFIIRDDYEDGICCEWGNGYYNVTQSDDGTVLASGGAWNGPNETTTFIVIQPPALTEGPTLTPSDVPTLHPSIAPSLQPTMYVERFNATAQVNIYLTGVPTDQNMTIAERQVFETLFYTVLQSRLETVNVDVLEVLVEAQINDPEFGADSPFDSNNVGGNGESDDLSILQLITNIKFTYSDPPPEGWRDWSIYLTKWIESFGPTVVDIFTDPKQELYPNEQFFNSISDVSATHVIPPNTDPTMSPTTSPTYLAAPEYKKPLVTGLASAGVVVVVLFFGGALWWKYRKLKMARTHDNIGSGDNLDEHEEEDEEELGSFDEGKSHEEEKSSLQDDNVPSTVLNSTSNSDNEDEQDDIDDDRSVDDNNDYSEGDSDKVESEEEDAHVETAPTVFEESLTPREEPVGVAALSNELQDDSAQYNEIVAAVLENNPNMTQVVLDNKRQIGNNDGGEALWQALITNNYVKKLSLRNSNITDEQMAALALALNENTSISTLSLQNNAFTSEGVEYLVVCLDSNSTIKMIELEGNANIDPRILDELQGILQSRGGHKEGASGDHAHKIETLLERIRGNDTNLTELDLRGIGIGQNDTNAIMEALAGNVCIRRVDLSSNMIDDHGVSTLSLSLAENTAITHLCLADNRITSIGAEYILCALHTNDTIADVDLAGNPVVSEVIAELNHTLSQRRTAEFQ